MPLVESQPAAPKKHWTPNHQLQMKDRTLIRPSLGPEKQQHIFLAWKERIKQKREKEGSRLTVSDKIRNDFYSRGTALNVCDAPRKSILRSLLKGLCHGF